MTRVPAVNIVLTNRALPQPQVFVSTIAYAAIASPPTSKTTLAASGRRR